MVCPVLGDSVRHLYIPRPEIDRYQRLGRGEASGVESFRSASVGVAIGPGVRVVVYYCRTYMKAVRGGGVKRGDVCHGMLCMFMITIGPMKKL